MKSVLIFSSFCYRIELLYFFFFWLNRRNETTFHFSQAIIFEMHLQLSKRLNNLIKRDGKQLNGDNQTKDAVRSCSCIDGIIFLPFVGTGNNAFICFCVLFQRLELLPVVLAQTRQTQNLRKFFGVNKFILFVQLLSFCASAMARLSQTPPQTNESEKKSKCKDEIAHKYRHKSFEPISYIEESVYLAITHKNLFSNCFVALST